MKILKYIGIIVLLLIAAILVAGLFMKKDFHFEKSIEINAPKDKVWENVVYFRNHEKWSQWKEIDPAMVVNITGTDGEKGAKMEWTSKHKDVGNGSQTISSVVPGTRVDTDLVFGGRGGAKSFISVSGDSTKCNVIWAMDMHADYPMNAIMGVFMKASTFDEMFNKGLGMLKTASEK